MYMLFICVIVFNCLAALNIEPGLEHPGEVKYVKARLDPATPFPRINSTWMFTDTLLVCMQDY